MRTHVGLWLLFMLITSLFGKPRLDRGWIVFTNRKFHYFQRVCVAGSVAGCNGETEVNVLKAEVCSLSLSLAFLGISWEEPIHCAGGEM